MVLVGIEVEDSPWHPAALYIPQSKECFDLLNDGLPRMAIPRMFQLDCFDESLAISSVRSQSDTWDLVSLEPQRRAL